MNIWFNINFNDGWLLFYGISTFLGYSKQNPVFMWIYLICKQIVGNFIFVRFHLFAYSEMVSCIPI